MVGWVQEAWAVEVEVAEAVQEAWEVWEAVQEAWEAWEDSLPLLTYLNNFNIHGRSI
jgi:hypothetical protein